MLASFSVAAALVARSLANAWIFGPNSFMSTLRSLPATPSDSPCSTIFSSSGDRLNDARLRLRATPSAYSVFSSSVFGSAATATCAANSRATAPATMCLNMRSILFNDPD